MNGVPSNHAQNTTTTKAAKPPPVGPTPPAPATAPPTPPVHSNATAHPPAGNRANAAHSHTPGTNGHHHHAQKGKKKNDVPVDPATMYESLKNRIAALEEEEVLEEEEERRFAEEAAKSVKGMAEAAIHAKYVELFAEFKRLERDHAKEKQKLVKDKDAAKSQLTKANQTKAKMENLARELQKDNKRLREDGKRLATSVEEAQDELLQMKNDLAKRADKAKLQDLKYREMPDIVVKVVCRYRAELFFKISRKTKLSRLFNAWTDRMERPAVGKKGNGGTDGAGGNQMNGSAKSEAASTQPSGSAVTTPTMQFIFTHNGRSLEAEQTPEEAGMEDGDEILAVEMMDLTDGPGPDEWVSYNVHLARTRSRRGVWDQTKYAEPQREKLKKNWNDNPQEAKRTLEEIFDGVVRERLKEVLRQYELREKHFECVIRSKELEVLLSRARAAEQKQLAEGEKARADKQEDENQQLRKELEEAQNGQTMLIDKLIACCKEIIQKPNAERTQRLFASLREELERKGPRGTKKSADGPVGG
ncbi:putative myosin-like coiled-coil protein [Lyophyllum shimeji]|uniref:Myosin-like coiled-coil protein n=1 Tax=Lyophyllum shimeji TaxID=47721 RepID=A0A9P3UJN1_LYOSH|nr:putative myosin-like coiled-coil protein [Lyophyllum shimeji]